jgi:hypothetical protein
MPGDKLNDMENNPTSVEELFSKLKDYVETTIDLFKLKAINKVSGLLSTIIVSVVLIMLLFLLVICLTIGFALLIGMWLGHAFWGFFIMGAVYVIIGLVMYKSKNKLLKEPISNTLIKELVD